jgi:dCMP deaminase
MGYTSTGEPPAVSDLDRYYMDIAEAVAKRATCRRRKVGAVIVRERRILSTGYNGTPQGVDNCEDGGCGRCDPASGIEPGTAYDLCLCVHAEENAVLTVARFGSGGLDDTTMYTTLQPCFSCLRQLIQAGITKVFYGEVWENSTAPQWALEDYERLVGVLQLIPISSSVSGQQPAPQAA